MCATALSLPPRFTPDQYLELERTAEYRSEFIDGFIYAMSGGTFTHARIAGDLYSSLETRLQGGNCQAIQFDLKVWMPSVVTFLYPDVQIICGKPRFRNNRQDVIENPSVIVEILSDSTEKYDRGAKFHAYQTIPELKHYVLVTQDHALVEVFTRSEGHWILDTYRGLEAVVDLPAIGIAIPLAEIYRRVEFPAATPPEHTAAVTE